MVICLTVDVASVAVPRGLSVHPVPAFIVTALVPTFSKSISFLKPLTLRPATEIILLAVSNVTVIGPPPVPNSTIPSAILVAVITPPLVIKPDDVYLCSFNMSFSAVNYNDIILALL